MSTPSQPPTSRGLFIVLEGLDRSGKSTQCELLIQRLQAQGRAVQGWKFPDRTTPTGILIDRYLRKEVEIGGEDGRAIHLLFSANRWECSTAIEALLVSGTSVVCDRYAFSGLAFSLAKGLDASYLVPPDKGLPLPDLTLFLSLSSEQTKLRGGFGDERYELVEFQAIVKVKFEWVGQEVGRVHGAGKWKEIDAGGTVEEVREAMGALIDELASREGGGVKAKLWT